MRGGTAACGKNTGDLRRVETGNVGRADFIHHQNVGFVRSCNGFDATDLRQHAATDVTQVCGALGQQCVLQLFLLNRSGLDNRGPGRGRAFVVVEARFDFAGQFRVFKHLLVGDEDFPDGLGLAALNKIFDIAAHLADRLVQALALGSHRLAPLGIIEALQHLNVGRPHGNPR